MTQQMRLLLIAALLTLAASAASAQRMTEQAGIDFKGADYSSFGARGPEECRELCARDRRCAAYTYRLRDHQCYLKSAVPRGREDRNAISGFKTGLLEGGRLSEEVGLDYRGGDYTSFIARELRECKRLCADQPQCRAYTFRLDSNECFLKNLVGPLQRDRNTVTGVKGGFGGGIGGGGRLSEERGLDHPGGDYNSFASGDVRDCKHACFEDRRCRAYTYRFDSRECFLKDRVYPAARDSRAVTGVKGY